MTPVILVVDNSTLSSTGIQRVKREASRVGELKLVQPGDLNGESTRDASAGIIFDSVRCDGIVHSGAKAIGALLRQKLGSLMLPFVVIDSVTGAKKIITSSGVEDPESGTNIPSLEIVLSSLVRRG